MVNLTMSLAGKKKSKFINNKLEETFILNVTFNGSINPNESNSSNSHKSWAIWRHLGATVLAFSRKTKGVALSDPSGLEWPWM